MKMTAQIISCWNKLAQVDPASADQFLNLMTEVTDPRKTK